LDEAAAMKKHYYSAKEVYKDLDANSFGGGKNAERIVDELFEIDDTWLIRNLLRKYNTICKEISFVEKISDKTVSAHLIQLILKDCQWYVDEYQTDLSLDLKKRFVAVIKRRIKKDQYE